MDCEGQRGLLYPYLPVWHLYCFLKIHFPLDHETLLLGTTNPIFFFTLAAILRNEP